MLACITGTIHPGSPPESLHLEPRIVSKTIYVQAFPHPLGFLQGIALQGVSRFRYITLQTHVCETLYLHLIIQQSTHFVKLVLIICSKDTCFHSLQKYTKKSK